MEFSASFDTSAKVITVGSFIVFAAIALWNALALKNAKGDWLNIVLRSVIFIVLLVAIGLSYFYSTTGYETKGKALIIKTHGKEITLNWMQINDVRLVGAGEMEGLSNTLGSRGLFGYSGHYHNASIGDMTFYGTQQKNWVLIHTDKNEAIIMTPNEPYKMVSEIKTIITPNN